MKIKYGFILFVNLACFMLISCSDNSTNTQNFDKLVLIEAEFEFDNDLVQISFDNEQLLNKRITTNYTVSLAWGSELKNISSNEHFIKTSMPEKGIEKTIIFIPEYDTTSISVRYNKGTGNIEYIEREGIILRD